MRQFYKRIFMFVVVFIVLMSLNMTTLAAENHTAVMTEKMLNKINDLRATYRLPALAVDPDLVTYAQIRANI